LKRLKHLKHSIRRMAMAYLMGTGVAIAEKEEAEEAQPSVGV
jgi:hypothetical protein